MGLHKREGNEINSNACTVIISKQVEDGLNRGSHIVEFNLIMGDYKGKNKLYGLGVISSLLIRKSF